MTVSYGLLGIGLYFLGLFSAIASTHLLRKVLALNVTGVGVFLTLIAIAAESREEPDPIPQAMVLTGVVVAMALSGFALGLARQIAHRTGAWNLPEDRNRQLW